MRRPMELGSLFALVLAALVGLAMPARGAGQEATPVAAEQATPAARAGSPPSEGVEVVGLGIVEVAGDEQPAQQVVLTRVTIQPGAAVADHPHGGTSIFFVESGTVCYEHTDERPGATATAYTEGTATGEVEGCAAPEAECGGDAGCTLEADDTIVLDAGDSVTQTQTRSHAYRNVGEGEAVVLISELQRIDIEGCSGGCM